MVGGFRGLFGFGDRGRGGVRGWFGALLFGFLDFGGGGDAFEAEGAGFGGGVVGGGHSWLERGGDEVRMCL